RSRSRAGREMTSRRLSAFPDAARAFAFPLTPANRRRLVVGGLLNAVPVAGACWSAGYTLEAIRRLNAGEEALPEWRGWGRLFVEGVVYYVIPTLYLFPALALYAACTGIAAAVPV